MIPARLAIFLLLILGYLTSQGQALNKSINADSLFNAELKGLPKELKDQLQQEYQSGSKQDKEFLLFMLSMQRSSKKQLTYNVDSNYTNINKLKLEYAKLVPRNYIVSIEFNPANPNFNIKESINMRITKTDNKETTVSQDWNMEYNSDKLKQMLKQLDWDMRSVSAVKKLLFDANCISIENGEIATIGFARSGLGEYSYLIFNADLTKNEVKSYNDGCNDIFYKKNIVLQYDGGAAGPQCFPDKEK